MDMYIDLICVYVWYGACVCTSVYVYAYMYMYVYACGHICMLVCVCSCIPPVIHLLTACCMFSTRTYWNIQRTSLWLSLLSQNICLCAHGHGPGISQYE